MKKTGILIIIGTIVAAGAGGALLSAAAATSAASSLTRTELEAKIKEKTQQLAAIDKELMSAKTNLDMTKQERLTLQREIATLNNNIKTLNLGIKADTLTTQQLQFEIEALNYDLRDIKDSVALKQEAIGSILKELQRSDAENKNPLILLLKSGSLADSVLEAQASQNLQSQLALDINGLKNLYAQYDGKLHESSVKKDQVVAHQRNLQNKKGIVQDQTAEKQNVLVTTKNQESIYQKQLAELQKQQRSIADDIEALDAVLRLKIDTSTLPPLASGVLLIPITGSTKANITQGYGATEFAKNGYRGQWHNGIDFRAAIGTPILAAEDGTVIATGNQDAYCRKGAYGKFIVVNHGNGLTTLYAHLSRILVEKGDIIKRGWVIGYSGQTGYATGPHLHFTVYAQATFYMGQSKVCGPMPYGGDLNPVGYL